jgi:catechol 2,3-dioxygenase-like lactoylglutathione lyase family enzyme
MFDQQITFLYTHNIDETAHFYGEVFGLPLVLDQGDCRIWQVNEAAFLGFCQRESAPTTDSQNIIFTFVTNDVEGWYQRLSAQGVTFTKAPELNPTYNITHCFLRDPNGYLLEIQRFEDPFP